MWLHKLLDTCRGKLKPIIIANLILVIVMSFTLSSGPLLAEEHATSTSDHACAITPELLLGQGGFAVAGQGGFAVTGLGGFAVTGLGGFAVTGLGGFALAGQRGFAVTGLSDLTLEEIELLIQEIENNTISKDWIQAFMPEISFGDEFNTVHTAVLIVDDFEEGDLNEHGELVGRIFIDLRNSVNAWLVANTSYTDIAIEFYGVDISADGSYRLDLISAAIQSRVAELRQSGYNHFVLNMSFGLLPCEDAELNFDFDDFLDARDDAQGPQAVAPIAECVTNHQNGVYTAHFGYENFNPQVVELPIGDNNRFLEGSADKYQVTTFQPGRQFDVFRVDFYGSSITWVVRGPSGEQLTATASVESPLCNAYQAASAPVIPHLDCIVAEPGGGFKAFFGYENMNSAAVRIPVGENNRFTPAPRLDYGQQRVFAPAAGRLFDAFEVNFSGGVIAWTLQGPDGVRRTAFANSADESLRCAPYPTFDQPFSLYTYLQQRGDDPAAVIGALFNKVDDTPNPLQPLQTLLAGYLQETADPNNPLQLIAMASSGNYATLVGDLASGAPPLYPAAFIETIAVGATLGEGTQRWAGSHNANIMAPGAWYLFSENFAGAGTSYSAPHASMIAALYLTYPDACEYLANSRPLKPEAVGLNNVPFLANLSMPLSCFPNNAPVAVDDVAQTTYGAAVTINVLANDNDPNGDTIHVSAVQTPPNGTASINAENTTVTYTPNLDFPTNPGEVVTDGFQYEISDGRLEAIANITVEVNRLDLIATCPTGNFVVRNNGTAAVNFEWNVEGTALSGQGVAQPGDTSIQTDAPANSNVNLSAAGVVNDTATPLGPEICLPSITRLVVVDSETNLDLYELTHGLVIDLTRVPGHKINIRAEVGGEFMTTESVVFGLNDNATYTIDNSVFYTLAPEVNGDYDWWRAQPNSSYRLTVTPYTGTDATGFAGNSRTVEFSVIESRALSELSLTPTCPQGEFQVLNPNDVAVEFTWKADITGTTGTGTVDALADTSINTGVDDGMVHLYVTDVEHDAEPVIENCAPSFSTVPDTQYNAKRDQVQLQLTATDPDPGDVLTFSASGLPKGLSIDAATGLISGAVHQSASSGQHQVTATVNDQYGAQSSITFLWMIE